MGANPRTACDIAVVINSDAKSIRVAGEGRQLLDLALFRPPNDSLELEDLGRRAGCILNAILRNSDDLAPVIDAIGLRVIAPSQRGERRHDAVLPKEPETGNPVVKARERDTNAK
jgi:hypothetical protein